jgi:tripartite-type tricarboxylate transporter receptor subunit TctC
MRLILAALAAVALMGGSASAQDYPTQPVRIMVGSSAGGGMDTIARTVAEYLSPILGEQVVVENQPGAGGTIALAGVANAEPDGYTIILSETGAALVNPLTLEDVGYDTLSDLEPVAHVTSAPFALVAHPDLGVTDMAGLIEVAKDRPGELFYATSGINTLVHMLGEMISGMAGIEMEAVGYQGGAPSVAAVVSGEVDLGILSLSAAQAQADAGAIVILGITYPERLADFPDLPTIGETVEGFASWPSQFILAPTGTPPEVLNTLSEAVGEVMENPEVNDILIKRGLLPDYQSREELAAALPGMAETWAETTKRVVGKEN